MIAKCNDNKKKNSYLELTRFVVSILIMVTHLFYIGLPKGKYLFAGSWIYVEFFFLITGYVTTRHFMEQEKNSFWKRLLNSFIYTVRKFYRLMPYSVFVVVAAYAVESWKFYRLGEYWFNWKWFCAELFFLSEVFNYPIITGTLWYLCAMFVVFPMFCFIIQFLNRNFLFLFTAGIGIAYYGFYGFEGLRYYPLDLMRAFACMCLGTVVYYFAEELSKLHLSGLLQIVFTLFESVALIGTFIIAGYNLGKFYIIALVLFGVFLAILFSGNSLTSHLNVHFFEFLGKLSLPIFMWQWTIASLILVISSEASISTRIMFYFIGTIVISLVQMYIVETLRNKKLLQKCAGNRKERRNNCV